MYQDLQQRADAFSYLCRYPTPVSISLGDWAERVIGELVSGNYFQALDIGPAVGRVFSPEEDDRVYAGHPVVVLSYPYWVVRFGADAGVIGSKILVNSYPMVIVGVSPKGFRGSNPRDRRRFASHPGEALDNPREAIIWATGARGELHQEIDVAFRPGIATQNGAEQGEPGDTKRTDFRFGSRQKFRSLFPSWKAPVSQIVSAGGPGVCPPYRYSTPRGRMMSCSSCSRMRPCHTYSRRFGGWRHSSWLPAGKAGRLNCRMTVIAYPGNAGT